MTFLETARAHWAKYPRMEPQDFVKLAYQSEYGPEHLVTDQESVLAGLVTECRGLTPGLPTQPPEPIGGGLCRCFLDGTGPRDLPLLARCFTATARRHQGSRAGLEEKLDALSALSVPGMEDYLAAYRADHCPPVHHSPAFRDAYHPHYRVLHMDYVNYKLLLLSLASLWEEGRSAVVAIDGRCGSGKTALAALISDLFPCTVLHMDDFFLPPERRTPERLSAPGGNVDYERFQAEVLTPLSRGEPVAYRRFDCRTGALGEPVDLPSRPLTLVEGSYSLHPALREGYDLSVFLTCTPEEQRRRLLAREGPQGVVPFLERWIPLEERYFDACAVEEGSDLTVDTTHFFAS